MRNRYGWVPLSISAAVGIVLGVGGFTFHYAKGTSYLSNDPKACVNCHVMQEHYDSWIKSSHHAAATCNGCHVPHSFPGKFINKARNGWNHSKAFTLQDFPEPIRITGKNLEALQHNCISCHEVLVSETLEHHQIKKQRCTECHRSVGHMKLD